MRSYVSLNTGNISHCQNYISWCAAEGFQINSDRFVARTSGIYDIQKVMIVSKLVVWLTFSDLEDNQIGQNYPDQDRNWKMASPELVLTFACLYGVRGYKLDKFKIRALRQAKRLWVGESMGDVLSCMVLSHNKP